MSEFHLVPDKTSGRYILRGHLEDTTDFSTYQEELAKCKVIDFSELYTTSFFGIQNLIHALKVIDHQIRIEKVPSHSYRQLILFLPDAPNVEVESFYVDVANEADGIQQKLLTDQQLDSIKSTFVSFDDDLLVGAMHSLSPSPREFTLNFENVWCRDNEAQAKFWFDYLSFIHLSTEACALMQKATLTLTLEMLHQLVMQVKSQYRRYKPIFGEDERYNPKALSNLINEVMEFSDTNDTKIKERSEELAKTKLKVIQVSLNKKAPQEEYLLTIKSGLDQAERLVELTSALDESGKVLGEHCTSLYFILDWGKSYREMPPPSVEDLPKLLRRWRLENVQSWDNALNSVEVEFQTLRKLFDRIIVTLQQFDLIKQVFEHRINEAKQVKMDQSSNSLEFQEVKDNLLEKISGKLVTDVEKLAYRFFFPDAENQREQTLAAGDVELF